MGYSCRVCSHQPMRCGVRGVMCGVQCVLVLKRPDAERTLVSRCACLMVSRGIPGRFVVSRECHVSPGRAPPAATAGATHTRVVVVWGGRKCIRVSYPFASLLALPFCWMVLRMDTGGGHHGTLSAVCDEGGGERPEAATLETHTHLNRGGREERV